MFMLDSKGVKNRKVNLQIKDVGHRFVRDNMYEGIDTCLVCFDITKEASFFEMSKICKNLTELQKNVNVKKHILVCGLRSDLTSDRAVPYQDAERTAETFGAPYIECSAKLDQNIEAVFDLVLTQIFK